MNGDDLLLLARALGGGVLKSVALWGGAALAFAIALQLLLGRLGAFSIAGEPRRSLRWFSGVTLLLLFVPAMALLGGVRGAGQAGLTMLGHLATRADTARAVGTLFVLPLHWVHVKEHDAQRIVPVSGDELWDADVSHFATDATLTRAIRALSSEVIDGVAAQVVAVRELRRSATGRWLVTRSLRLGKGALRRGHTAYAKLLQPIPAGRPLTLAALSTLVGQRLIGDSYRASVRRELRRMQWVVAGGGIGLSLLLWILGNWSIRRRQRPLTKSDST